MQKRAAVATIRSGYPDTEPWLIPDDANKIFRNTIPEDQRPEDKERKGWFIFLARDTTDKAFYQCIMCAVHPPDRIRPQGTFNKGSPEFQDACRAMIPFVNALAQKDVIDDRDFTLIIRISLDTFFYKLADGVQF